MWRFLGIEPSFMYGGIGVFRCSTIADRSPPGDSRRNAAVPQGTEAFDRQLHNIARLEPAAGGFGRELEDAAGADRSGPEDVARAGPRVAARVRDQLGPGPVHRARISA